MTGVGQAVDISRVLVSEEVREIRREGWSGVLALTQGEVAKGLYFVDGEIAFAASTVEEDRLGANLYRIGRITEAQFRAGMAAAQSPGRRLGQALIEAGVLSDTELAAAVTGQVERIVLSVFRWSTGKMQRRGMDRPLPADLVLDLSTPRLLLLGARELLDPRRLGRVLGENDRRLRRVPRVSFDYDQLPPSPPERAVLAMATRETTLGEALSLPHSRSQLVRAAYALVVGGLLELLEPVAAPGEEPASEPEAAVPEVAAVGEVAPSSDPDDTLRASTGLRGAEPPVSADEPSAREPPAAAERAHRTARPAGQSTRPMTAVDPDLLTPTPPPNSEIPGEAEPVFDEPPGGGAHAAPAPALEVPADPEEAERRARALLESGLREPAVAVLEGLLERHPESHGVRRLLAMTLAHSGKFDPAIERHFLAVIETDPGDVEARYRLATYYRRVGMAARAVLQLRLVLSADPGHAGAWRDLGELDAGEGRRGR